MFILKHLKTLQHVSIVIQIIFRELVCSLLKSLILKFVKNVKSQCGDAAACCRITTLTSLTYYQSKSTLCNILEGPRKPEIIRQEKCFGEINHCQTILAKEKMS